MDSSRGTGLGCAGNLATRLDVQMVGPGNIAPSTTSDQELQARSGNDVAKELAGRPLLRYLTYDQVAPFHNPTGAVTHVTPTPYAPSDAAHHLALPMATTPRTHVLLLDPEELELICGPRWIASGNGIEYLLPEGFPREAMVHPPWPIEVR